MSIKNNTTFLSGKIFMLLFISTIFSVYCAAAVSDSETLTIKIVEDIDHSWGNNIWNQPNVQSTLEPHIKEANFSGPNHFQTLLGKCFEKITTSYKYVFCPFYNVTQHEISLQWKPYNGILGIWQEWEIKNNTFTAMLMKDGDKCGRFHRSVRVVFECATGNQIRDVTEPELCHYLLHFETPLVCEEHVMLVYPHLSAELRDNWDEIEGELLRDEITIKGYKKELQKIFTKAGFFITNETRKSLIKNIPEKNPANEKTDKFDSLEKCSAEYSKLQAEIEGLRTLITLTAQSKHLERKNVENKQSSTKVTPSSPLFKIPKKKN